MNVKVYNRNKLAELEIPSLELIEKFIALTAERMMSIKNSKIYEECPIGIIDINLWEWPQGVGMYGLYRVYQETGEKSYLDRIDNWYKQRISEGLPYKNVNTMAPMLTLCYLFEETENEEYLELIREWAEWVMSEMPRTCEGGLQHIVSGETNEQQLWDDTLFMTVLFLAKAGLLLDRKDFIDESVFQFLIHIKYLTDRKTGLWFHGWTFLENNNFAEALWGRGNCWYTAGVIDYLEMVDSEPGVKKYLLVTLERQVKALEKVQNESGMWNTLLDDTDSYIETSATAGFCYGILKGVRLGHLDKKYLPMGIKSLNALIHNISDNGTVENVSYGTGMGSDLNHYREIPLNEMTYGQALAILALSEGMKLHDVKGDSEYGILL